MSIIALNPVRHRLKVLPQRLSVNTHVHLALGHMRHLPHDIIQRRIYARKLSACDHRKYQDHQNQQQRHHQNGMHTRLVQLLQRCHAEQIIVPASNLVIADQHPVLLEASMRTVQIFRDTGGLLIFLHLLPGNQITV